MEIMNVSDQIIQVLDDICRRFGLAIDWTNENIIPWITALCTKLISYEIWTSVAWLVISAIAVLTMVMFIKKYNRTLMSDVDDEGFTMFICMMETVFFAVFGIGIIVQIMDIIKCVTFPELFIFEYIKDALNSGT